MKKILLLLIVVVVLAAGVAEAKYQREGENNKNFEEKQITAQNSDFEKQEQMQNLIEDMKKIGDALHDVSEATRDICMAWFYENNVVNNIAAPICKCEQDTVYNEIPLNDILYYQDNIGRWNFLIYKKDAKALEINEKIGKIRLKCIDMFSGKSN